jgi:hypothetical protein
VRRLALDHVKPAEGSDEALLPYGKMRSYARMVEESGVGKLDVSTTSGAVMADLFDERMKKIHEEKMKKVKEEKRTPFDEDGSIAAIVNELKVRHGMYPRHFVNWISYFDTLIKH